jgi:arylsulfatase A-like enzyme
MKKGSPNILLIIMDTVRAKSMSLYGHRNRTTPNLERISEKATIYKKCFTTANWTIPSHASLFSGLYPSEHGSYADTHMSLNTQLALLPWVLKKHGYITGCISSNPFLSKKFNYNFGFDVMKNFVIKYDDLGAEKVRRMVSGKKKPEQAIDLIKYIFEERQIKDVFRAVVNWLGNPDSALKNSTPLTFKTKKQIFNFIDSYSNGRKPWFLFVNFIQCHGKYNPPEPYRYKFMKRNPEIEKRIWKFNNLDYYAGRWMPSPEETEYMHSLYEGEILFLDSVIGEIYDHLEKYYFLDNTMLIITSDHGEHLGEKGHLGHSFSIYNELFHIPLIIRYPYRHVPSGYESRLCQINDIYATILDVLESAFPSPDSSVSLLGKNKKQYAMLQGFHPKNSLSLEGMKRRNAIFNPDEFSHRSSNIAVIDESFLKAIRYSDHRTEIYDLKEDFYESHPLPLHMDQCTKILKLLDKVSVESGWKRIVQSCCF